MSIQESDILFFVGGACWEQFGTPTRRTAVPRRGGEEDVETFTRSGVVGTYRSHDGFLHTAEANTPRVWFGDLSSGVRTPHLLLEPARTNVCIRSQEFDNAAWTKTRATISADSDTAPDNTATADRLIEDATASSTHFCQSTAFTVTDGGEIVCSVYSRGNSRTWIALECNDGGSDAFTAFFNLSTGAVGTTSSGGGGTFTRAYTETAQNDDGTYRCVVVGSLGSGDTSASLRIYLADADNSSSYNGDGASNVRVWGAHCEDSQDEASSYIATTTVAVTRNADVFTLPYYGEPMAAQIYTRHRVIQQPTYTTERVLQIGAADGSTPTWILQYWPSDLFRAILNDGTDTSSSTVDLNPTSNDLVETLTTIASTGAVTLAGRTNGGATTTGTPGSTMTLPTSWSGPLLSLHAQGNGNAPSIGRVGAVIGTRGTGHTQDEFAALV